VNMAATLGPGLRIASTWSRNYLRSPGRAKVCDNNETIPDEWRTLLRYVSQSPERVCNVRHQSPENMLAW
jgi:hypothetical protein